MYTLYLICSYFTVISYISRGVNFLLSAGFLFVGGENSDSGLREYCLYQAGIAFWYSFRPPSVEKADQTCSQPRWKYLDTTSHHLDLTRGRKGIKRPNGFMLKCLVSIISKGWLILQQLVQSVKREALKLEALCFPFYGRRAPFERSLDKEKKLCCQTEHPFPEPPPPFPLNTQWECQSLWSSEPVPE